MPVNYEFKARVTDIHRLEQKLLSLNPVFSGEDNQCDTYFNVQEGRLKLREGNIENALIYYKRADTAGAKISEVMLYEHHPDIALKNILEKVHGVKVIVNKKRRIYFIENVKFHFDVVDNLGQFVEVEAIDKSGSQGVELIKQQCDHYASFLEIKDADYVSLSYSDLFLNQASG
jgi:predicted adenylyl cyclase CyaB